MSENQLDWGCDVQAGHYPLKEYAAKKKGLVGKYVIWAKQERTNAKKMAVALLTAAQAVGLSASIIGIPVVYKAVKLSKRLKSYEKFEAEAEEKCKNPPLSSLRIEIKTEKATFNHVNDYVLHEDLIWCRKRNCLDDPWKPLYFDGYRKDRIPVKIQADGGNFIAVDDKRTVSYKKVLKEILRIFEKEALASKRPAENSLPDASNETCEFLIKEGFIWARNCGDIQWEPFYFEGWPNNLPKSLDLHDNTLVITDQEGQVYEKDISEITIEGKKFPYWYIYSYTAITKDFKDNWKTRWFTLPYLSALANLLKEKKIKLSKDTIDIAISNRGAYSAYWKDDAGVEHPAYISVTTLYALREGENFIRYADPWLPFKFCERSFPTVKKKKIHLPTNFKAEKLSASASTLFIYGKDAEGNDKLFTRLADFDTEKVNPLLPYGNTEDIISVNPDTIDTETRFLPKDYEERSPDLLWTSIPLEGLHLAGANFKKICILQTGQGNQARELRIKGTNEFGQKGYYKKSLEEIDVDWAFTI